MEGQRLLRVLMLLCISIYTATGQNTTTGEPGNTTEVTNSLSSTTGPQTTINSTTTPATFAVITSESATGTTDGTTTINGTSEYSTDTSITSPVTTSPTPITDRPITDCFPNPCMNGGFCSDFMNNYTCDCSGTGFEGENCTMDIDECTTGMDNCDFNAVCVNTNGSFTCICNPGWTGDGEICSDIDECTDGSNNCDLNAMCVNTAGSFTCNCNAGWTGNGVTCFVVTCSIPTFPPNLLTPETSCLSMEEVPYNTTCQYVCDVGYNLTGDLLVTCLEDGSLSTALPSCQDMQPPNIICSPNITVPTIPGEEYSNVTVPEPEVVGESGTVQFINASAQVDLIIGLHEIVFQATDDSGNTAFCSVFVLVEDVEDPVVTCPADIIAYTLPGLPHAIIVIPSPNVTDNSIDGVIVSGNDTILVVGIGTSQFGFSAEDLAGNEGSCNFMITVIDNEAPNITCPNDRIRMQDPGSPLTIVVWPPPMIVDNSNFTTPPIVIPLRGSQFPVGTTVVNITTSDLSGNNATCEFTVTVFDVDECLNNNTNDCDLNALCTNTNGSFTCTCEDGYTGNGTQCEDIDECMDELDDCDINAECINLPGTYTCQCLNGYTAIGTNCADTDECFGQHECDINAECINLPGTYTCQCFSGFTGNVTNCTDIDECMVELDDCDINAECINLPGTYTCQCFPGYTGNGTNCTDIDECFGEFEEHDCDINAECINLPGTYTCQCFSGYSGNGTNCTVVSCSIPDLPSRISPVTSQCDGGLSINYTQSCSYSCDLGYNLVGTQSVLCLSNMSLSDSLPTCEVNTCAVPQLSPNLLSPCRGGQNIEYNTSCDFSCDIGYNLNGTSSLDCLASGNFSDEIPLCQIVMCPLTRVLSSELSFGNCSASDSIDFSTSCTLQCSEGYDLIGSDTVTCQSNGTISAPLPSCNVVSCPIPELPPRLLPVTSQCDGRLSINYTESCSYSCDVGYNLLGESFLTCLANTSLSDSLPTCEVETCFVPQLHPNLLSTCNEGQNVEYNTSCDFSCDIGYNLTGMSSLDCLASGNFSDEIPSCQIVTCPVSRTLSSELSFVNCSAGGLADYAITCTFQCSIGFTLIGSEATTCQSDGNLSPIFPTCELVTCPVPSMFPTFLSSTTNTNNCTEGGLIEYNTTCSFDCQPGYNLTGNSSVICQEDGEISSELPRCGIVQCFVPAFTEGLISTENSCEQRTYINYTDSCFFDCDVGYNLTGSTMVTCEEDTALSSALPSCQVVTCQIPPFPPNLLTPDQSCLSMEEVPYNTTCQYVCDVGYNLTGDSAVTCLEDGSLSASLPSCQVVTCSIPELPSRLSHVTSQCNGGLTINYTDSCSYSCDMGYNPVGTPTVTCLEDMSLSDTLPTCEVVTCSVPQLSPNLLSPCKGGPNVEYNTSCDFSCDIGYNLNGTSSLDCLATGNFSDEIPLCQIVECPIPDNMSPVLLDTYGNCSDRSSIDFGTSCTGECSIGYTLQGNETIYCQSDGNFSDRLPTCNVVTCLIPELQPLLSPVTSQCIGGLTINYTESCSYSCDVGYNLVGASSVSCLANASLSDYLPTCAVVTCSFMQLSANLQSSCTVGQNIEYNASCDFSCDIGYNLLGMSSLDCLANGSFSDGIPSCQIVTCPIPEVFSPELSSTLPNCNAGNFIEYGTTCSFECSVGYDLIGSGSTTCESNGELSASIPTCTVVSCSIPELPPRLSPVTSQCDGGLTIDYTESCSYLCDVGYNRVGVSSIMCLANASLTDALPTCEVETCRVPLLTPFLSSTCTAGQNVVYNTSCDFSCDIGYNLVGESSLNCLANGNFTADAPTCEIVVCPLPQAYSHELSSSFANCSAGSSINYNTGCMFECSIGYNLIGSESVTCLSDGTLSSSIPVCLVVRCSIPAFTANLTTSDTQCSGEMVIDYNTQCMYGCQPGYDVIGNSSSTCQANGALSADLPTCEVIDICRRFRPCPAVSTCTGGINSYTCACNSGYNTDVTMTGDTTTYMCVDINECAFVPSACDVNARCDNLPGTYLCTCLERFRGNGTFCEVIKPCSLQPCLNGGTCTPGSDETSYTCACQASYSDVNCNTLIVEQEPIGVENDPSDQMVDAQERATFMCSFRNAQSFRWYKDGVSIASSENRSQLVINPTLAQDQGYYYCIALGEDGSISTKRARLTVNGVDNYVVMASFLTKTFNNSLLDRTSSYFQETAAELIQFIQTPLQNSFTDNIAVAINNFSSGSVMADFGIYVYNGSGSDADQLSVITSTMTSLAEMDPDFLDPGSIQTFSTVTCPAGSFLTNYSSVAMFNSGSIGSRANSTDRNCPDYTEKRDLRVEAKCDGDYIRPCAWVPQMNCGGNLTADKLLENLNGTEVTAANAEDIAKDVAEITTMTENITTYGLELVADILEDITEVQSSDVEVTESVVEVLSNVANLPEEKLENTTATTTSRIVMFFETQLSVVEVQNESLRIVEPNIAAEVLDVTPQSIPEGLTIIMSADGERISEEDFKVEMGDTTAEEEAIKASATLFIPSSVAETGATSRVVVTTHLNAALFRDKQLTELNKNQTEFRRQVCSRIIAASVNDTEIENLPQPAMTAFTPIKECMKNGKNATCVSYDFDLNEWSPRGCNKTSTDRSRITCECNHLTNFGVLMDIYGEQGNFILEIISYIGCSMSIWGLIITILTYATNKKLRDRKPNQILLSLSSSLLGLYIIFLVMISVDTEQFKEEIPPIPCCVLAGFLHYFTLTSLFWMGVEGYNMHILFVRVLNSYLPRFMRKASLVAWGVPMIIVGITGGAARQDYARTDFCFLEMWPMIGGLLIPIGFIMIFNVVIFIRVILRLNRTIKGRMLDKTEKRQRLRRFQNAVCILILMGLTWSIGYMSIVRPLSEIIQGLFTVFNSLQGYFIFMLYCVRQPQVRRTWRSQFSCCLPKSFVASGFTSTSGQTNSTFKNSSAKKNIAKRKNARPTSDSDSIGFRPETISPSPLESVPRGFAYDNSGANLLQDNDI